MAGQVRSSSCPVTPESGLEPMARGIFLGAVERQYTGRDGQPRIARNLSFQVDGEGAGQLFVGDEQLYKRAAQIKVGTPVELGFDLRLFRGEFQARLSDVRPVSG